jgi:citrate synthase
MEVQWYHPGLEGVVAGETNICSLDDGLLYRGYCIHELAEHASLLEVAYLLLYEELPSVEQLADFDSSIAEAAALPPLVIDVLQQLPLHVSPVAALRTGLAILSHDDGQDADGTEGSGLAKALPIIARMPLLLGTWQQLREGREPPQWCADESYAANLYRLLLGRVPSLEQEQALDAALIAAGEQEFNPATFAARIVGSTNGDLYSAVLAGLAVHGGTRHSGDFESILALIEGLASPDDAADLVAGIVAKQERLPGFGHPAFSDCDPRAAVLESWTSRIARRGPFRGFEEAADAIERAVWETQHLPANMDWAFTRLLHYLGIPVDLHLGVFLCARTIGWCAHAIEQSESGMVIRPRARYRGVEAADFQPLGQRG